RSSPAGVSANPGRPRSISRSPSCTSSARTCCETAGCVSESAAAARENDRWCATSRKVSSRRGSSIDSAYRNARTIICVDRDVRQDWSHDSGERSTIDPPRDDRLQGCRPDASAPGPATVAPMADGLVFAFLDGQLLLLDGEVPTADRLAVGDEPLPVGPLGVAVALDTAPQLEGASLVGLRDFLSVADEELASAAGRAAQLVEWELGHAFCGRCGTPTEAAGTELARLCPSCGASYYPRITPAVIMLVEHGGRVLLARRAGLNRPFHSVLAGFVEPGETLEEAVCREVLEEAGVDVE